MAHLSDDNYITIQGYMRNHLNLKGNEMIIYAIIRGFTQDGNGEYSGGTEYIERWTDLSKRAILTILKSLTERGLLEKREEEVANHIKRCYYKAIKPNEEIDEPNNDLTGEKTSPPMKKLHRGGEKTSPGAVKKLHRGGEKTSPNNIIDKLNNNNNIVCSKVAELGNETLHTEDYEQLISSHDKDIVDAVIKRIVEAPYIGCLNPGVIDKWSTEAEERRKRKQKNVPAANHVSEFGFEPHEIDFKALEESILCNY